MAGGLSSDTRDFQQLIDHPIYACLGGLVVVVLVRNVVSESMRISFGCNPYTPGKSAELVKGWRSQVGRPIDQQQLKMVSQTRWQVGVRPDSNPELEVLNTRFIDIVGPMNAQVVIDRAGSPMPSANHRLRVTCRGSRPKGADLSRSIGSVLENSPVLSLYT